MAVVVVCALAASAVVTAAPSANAAPRWAPASQATIHPGVRTTTSGVQCRASFVFYDARAVYLGQAAHCAPLGAAVEIEGASRRGEVVYDSYSTMDRVGEPNEAIRHHGNNFALVRIHNADRGRVNPSVLFWGGPVAGRARSSFGAAVYSYGNPAVYSWPDSPWPTGTGVNQLAPRVGIDTGTALMPTIPWGGLRPDGETAGWIHYIHTAAPGMSGDRGSAVLDERGRALGIVGLPAYDGSDRVTDLAKAMRYMRAKTNLDTIQLAKGTTHFSALP